MFALDLDRMLTIFPKLHAVINTVNINVVNKNCFLYKQPQNMVLFTYHKTNTRITMLIQKLSIQSLIKYQI